MFTLRTTKKRVGMFIALVAGLALIAPLMAIPASASIPGDIPGTGVTGPPYYGPPLATGADPLGASWCVTGGGPAPTDITGNKGDIPYYAIGCTLQSMHDDLPFGDRLQIEQIGQSYLGKPLYGVVIDVRETADQQRDGQRADQLRAIMMDDPFTAKDKLDAWGDDVKITNYIEAAIHGNEQEGVDMLMELYYEMATTPRCADPEPAPCATRYLDDIMDHMVLVTVPGVNPDGRQAGTRANGSGLDMNRDLFNQYNPEIQAVTKYMAKWLPSEIQGLHGYYNPSLTEGTTKPHNPGYDMDLQFKWDRQRTLANRARLATVGYGAQIPLFDFTDAGSCRTSTNQVCNGTTNQPDLGQNPNNSQGWDSWGPFYEGQWGQLIGLDGGTVEMCGNNTNPASGCANNGGMPTGRPGSILNERLINYSTMEMMISNRAEMLQDHVEKYRRGVVNAPRPPWSNVTDIYPLGETEHNWMVEFPTAFIIPVGKYQRSTSEPARLVQWCIDNNIRVHALKSDYTYDGRTYKAGSYIVPMTQGLRGLAYTALSYGTDISNLISDLYATPAAWSHGQLWGADVLEVPRADMGTFTPPVGPALSAPKKAGKPIKKGPGKFMALKMDGAGAVRTANAILNQGIPGLVAESTFVASNGKTQPTGSVLFKATSADTKAIRQAAKTYNVLYTRTKKADLPATTTIGKTRVAVIGSNDAMLGIRSLGFEANTVTLAQVGTGALDNYEVVYNAGGAPSAGVQGNAVGAFFLRGGGYIGQGSNGATFANSANIAGGNLTGGGAATAAGSSNMASNNHTLGMIGIWKTATGPGTGDDSPILGGYPNWSDYGDNVYVPSTLIWFSNIGANSVADARYRSSTATGTYQGDPNSMMGAGLWRNRTAAPTDQAIFAHGVQASGANAGARYALFAEQMFSRVDGERNWPAVGAGIFWSNQTVAGLPVIP